MTSLFCELTAINSALNETGTIEPIKVYYLNSNDLFYIPFITTHTTDPVSVIEVHSDLVKQIANRNTVNGIYITDDIDLTIASLPTGDRTIKEALVYSPPRDCGSTVRIVSRWGVNLQNTREFDGLSGFLVNPTPTSSNEQPVSQVLLYPNVYTDQCGIEVDPGTIEPDASVEECGPGTTLDYYKPTLTDSEFVDSLVAKETGETYNDGGTIAVSSLEEDTFVETPSTVMLPIRNSVSGVSPTGAYGIKFELISAGYFKPGTLNADSESVIAILITPSPMSTVPIINDKGLPLYHGGIVIHLNPHTTYPVITDGNGVELFGTVIDDLEPHSLIDGAVPNNFNPRFTPVEINIYQLEDGNLGLLFKESGLVKYQLQSSIPYFTSGLYGLHIHSEADGNPFPAVAAMDTISYLYGDREGVCKTRGIPLCDCDTPPAEEVTDVVDTTTDTPLYQATDLTTVRFEITNPGFEKVKITLSIGDESPLYKGHDVSPGKAYAMVTSTYLLNKDDTVNLSVASGQVSVKMFYRTIPEELCLINTAAQI